MAGAAHDVAVRIAEALGGAADRRHAVFVEGDGVEMTNRLDLDPEAQRLGDLRRLGLDFFPHPVELGLIRRADVDGEDRPARDHVTRVRVDIGLADGAHGIRLVLHRHPVHELDDPRHAEPGIHPHLHRRRAGMRLLAGEPHLEPPEPLAVGDDADILALGLQDRALFDMQLEKRLHLAGADRLVAGPANALQLVAERLAVGVLAGIGPFKLVDAGEDARGQHGGREAGALLVGPVRDHDRVPRLDAEVVQRADDFEPPQHPQNPVILAARRLGIEMAAHIDRQGLGIGPLAAGEHGAHPVHAHRTARRLAPLLEERPALAIGIRQRLAVVAAGHAGPDPGHLHDRIPQTLAVDLQVLARGSHHGPPISVPARHAAFAPPAARPARPPSRQMTMPAGTSIFFDHLVKSNASYSPARVNEKLLGKGRRR